MKEINTILCPIDFSDASETALQATVALAEIMNAEVYLLHVVSKFDPVTTPSVALTPPILDQLPLFMEQMKTNAAAAMEDLEKRRVAGRVPVRHMVVIGSPADSIVKISAETEADLIVIATHGRSGFKGLLTGSVTEKVVRTAKIPVLTLPCEDGG